MKVWTNFQKDVFQQQNRRGGGQWNKTFRLRRNANEILLFIPLLIFDCSWRRQQSFSSHIIFLLRFVLFCPQTSWTYPQRFLTKMCKQGVPRFLSPVGCVTMTSMTRTRCTRRSQHWVQSNLINIYKYHNDLFQMIMYTRIHTFNYLFHRLLEEVDRFVRYLHDQPFSYPYSVKEVIKVRHSLFCPSLSFVCDVLTWQSVCCCASAKINSHWAATLVSALNTVKTLSHLRRDKLTVENTCSS